MELKKLNDTEAKRTIPQPDLEETLSLDEQVFRINNLKNQIASHQEAVKDLNTRLAKEESVLTELKALGLMTAQEANIASELKKINDKKK